jgi:hypothetical protein
MEVSFNCLDYSYLAVWSILGSILGYFSFRVGFDKTIKQLVFRCILSIGIGLLVAFSVALYLLEERNFSKNLSITLGVVASFGLPDFILRYYGTITKAIGSKLTDIITRESKKDRRD